MNLTMQENDKKKNGYAQQLNPIRKYPTEVHQFQNSAIHMEIANFSGVTVDVPFTFTPSEEPPRKLLHQFSNHHTFTFGLIECKFILV